MSHTSAAVYATVFVALYAAHMVADYWVQTQHQASTKGHAGWTGRLACLSHVGTYTLTAIIALTTVAWRLDLDLHLDATVAGLAVSAITHYIADRRTPIARLAAWLRKDPAWLTRGGGLAALDQAWHIGWLAVAALIVAG